MKGWVHSVQKNIFTDLYTHTTSANQSYYCKASSESWKYAKMLSCGSLKSFEMCCTLPRHWQLEIVCTTSSPPRVISKKLVHTLSSRFEGTFEGMECILYSIDWLDKGLLALVSRDGKKKTGWQMKATSTEIHGIESWCHCCPSIRLTILLPNFVYSLRGYNLNAPCQCT